MPVNSPFSTFVTIPLSNTLLCAMWSPLLVLSLLARLGAGASNDTATDSTVPTTAAASASTATAPAASASGNSDLALILSRRRSDLAEFPTPEALANVSTWISSQGADGRWSDVNYLSGCDARESLERRTAPDMLQNAQTGRFSNTGSAPSPSCRRGRA